MCRDLKMAIRAVPHLPMEMDESSPGAGRRNTVCQSRHKTTPNGEVDVALVSSWLRKERQLKGGC